MQQFVSVIMLSLLALLPFTLFAQWTSQTSGTTNNLHDIQFLDANYGVAVGDTGTVLITTNGGATWQLRNIATKNNLQSVEIISKDTILVAAGTYFDGQVYLSQDGGLNWNQVANGIDLAASGNFHFALNSETILRSPNAGETWDTMAIDIGGTTLLQQLHFPPGKVAYAIGDISGFSTYSVFAYRSDNDGESWNSLFPLDFPNNNSHTAAFFTSADTGYVFTNRNERFLPGRLNQLVKVYDFYFDEVQTQQWRFASEIVNDSLPTYIHDAHFVNNENGYAVGENGNIYKTSNAGVDWTTNYMGDQPLQSIFMLNASLGYAVGNHGIIVKFNGTTSTHEPKTLPLQFYPNPAQNDIRLEGIELSNAILTIYNASGQILQQKRLNGNVTIPLNQLSNGWYTVQVNNGAEIYCGKLVVSK